ncbi:MAG: hypothetical protein K2M04_06800 [Muribaculaceae bacterium]|nr:hypothetical protein [Muribaculaceae bacterium]
MSTNLSDSGFAPRKAITWKEFIQFNSDFPNNPNCLTINSDVPYTIAFNISVDSKDVFDVPQTIISGSVCYISTITLTPRQYTYKLTVNIDNYGMTPTQLLNGIKIKAQLYKYDDFGKHTLSNNLKLSPIINDMINSGLASNEISIKQNDVWGNWNGTNQHAKATIQIDTAYIDGTIDSAWQKVHNILLTIS